jgi:ribulose kinase
VVLPKPPQTPQPESPTDHRHKSSVYSEHPACAQLTLSNRDANHAINQKRKVLLLTWFHGGRNPVDNPYLPRVGETARPLRRRRVPQ